MAAQYPGAAGTDANLFVAVNNLSCTLTDNPLSSGAVTVNVNSTTGFPAAGYITIDAEAISYTALTGTSFTGCTRGADGTTAVPHVVGSSVLHNVVAAHHNVLKDEVKAVEADLVGVMASITPVVAANTSSSILQRIAHIVSQIKNGFGLTNWYDPVTAMMPKSGGTFTGAITAGANNPMAGFKFTGLGAGSAAGDSLRFEQMKVVQIVTGTSTTNFVSSSASFVTTNLSATITPTSASNKVMILAFLTVQSGVSNNEVLLTLARGGSNILAANGQQSFFSTAQLEIPCALGYIDAPASTSALTYAVQGKTSSAATSFGGSTATQFIILAEVIAS